MKHQHPASVARELRLRASLPSLRQLGLELHEFAQLTFGALRGDDKAVHDLRLATQEAATNLIEHGAVQGGELQVRFERRADELVVQLICRGPVFDPSAEPARLPDPEELAEGGYGLFLIRALSDAVHYSVGAEENTLTLIKCVPREQEAA